MSESEDPIKQLEDQIKPIFNRAVARALGAMDIENASHALKAAVKSAIWDTMNDVMKEIQRQSGDNNETIFKAPGRS